MPSRRSQFSSDLSCVELSRRDFLNGFLVASGGVAVSDSIPFRVLAEEVKNGICNGSIGNDPRALRSGNLPSAFNVAHWLRDRRLRFESHAVTLAPGCDGQEGKFPISEDDGHFDVIIVGAGLAGLSAAFYLLRRRAGTRILLIDANNHVGGNAARDNGPPLPVIASTAGSYCVAPYADFQKELYGELGIAWEKHKIADPLYSYYFDDKSPGVRAGYRGWNIDTYGKGLQDVPYSPQIIQDLMRCRAEFRNWSQKDGAPTDPPDSSNPRYDWLSEMTLDTYLTKILHCDPIVSDFYTRYTIDALGGTAYQVNAHSSISFLGAEYGDLFAFPGGTSELALRLTRWLTRSDQSHYAAEIRIGAVGLRVDQAASHSKSKTSVTYFRDKTFHRTTANAVILACQSHSARHLVAHLIDGLRKQAWDKFNTVPVVVANVAVRSAVPFADLGMGYNQYWWGSRYWADFVIADWATPDRSNADRPTVLTFFGGNTTPPEELPQERMKLLQTPFVDYENSLKDDLSRIMSGTRFDFDRDVSSISLYRWGHGMIMPTTKTVFGNAHVAGGQLNRAESPRHQACRPLGPISFAGQDSEGTPSVESATGSGFRAASEVLAQL